MLEYTPRIKTGNNRVSLNWTQLGAVMAGISAIDLPSLAIRNRKEAREFALEYGFDVDNPVALEEIARVHGEAIAFIGEFFLTEEQRNLITKEVSHPEHVIDLLVLSSNYLKKSNLTQMWACAVLKVMHGIFHIIHDSKLMYFDEIKKQIFDSIDKVIVCQDSQYFLTDNQMRIPLFHYEKKRNKGKKSILLKLLQKPSYVASDIYDHLGIRLIFQTKAECLFALKALRRNHLISVTNIKPFRSRNSLVDLNTTKSIFNRYRPLLNRTKEYPHEILQKIDEEVNAAAIEKSPSTNPHSSAQYQAIQVTARKMIRVDNPIYLKIKNLIDYMGDKLEVPDRFLIDLDHNREHSFYFDYEIQVLDRASYLNSLHGPASHEAYKKRQRKTARKRVLGSDLIKYLKKATLQKGGACA